MKTTVISSFLIATASLAFAQTPAVTYTTARPSVQKVVVEETYYYTVAPYEPVVVVPAVTRAEATYRTPEEAAIASVSAMRTLDFEWFRELWDPASQRVLEARDRSLGQTPQFWKEAWQRAFAQHTRVELTHRIRTDDYVLISYRLVNPANPADSLEMMTALKRQDGRWWATQDLAHDPIPGYWNKPGSRLQHTARQVPANIE